MIATESAPTREEEGREAARRLLQRDDGADAIFAACDAMALGALDAVAAADIAVPQDVGVIGFDDLLAGRYSAPPLTTLGPDPAAAGEALVDAVLSDSEEERQRRVPVSLITRGSTARSQ